MSHLSKVHQAQAQLLRERQAALAVKRAMEKAAARKTELEKKIILP